MHRRAFIGTASGALIWLSGCTNSIGSDPTATSTLSGSACQADRKPIGIDYNVRQESLAGFSLSLSTDSVRIGDQLTVQLRNTSTTVRASGNKWKFDMQRQSGEAWDSIFSIPETSYWTDMAFEHAPDEGYTWELTVTPDGLTPDEGEPAYHVCDPLQAGTYRFVYWGITPEENAGSEAGKEYALGREFTVSERK